MKRGEIKIEALKLMFAVNNADYTDADVDNLDLMKADRNYSDYLSAMVGSVNRCFAILEERRILPVRSMVLGDGGRYVLNAEDFFDVERIVYEGNGEYDGNCEYFREGDAVIIKDYDTHGEYRLLYRPSIPRVCAYTPDDTEIPIPDRIACYIPYFIKSELFRMDEPDEATEARRFFEAAIGDISKSESGRQTRVAHSYSVYEV